MASIFQNICVLLAALFGLAWMVAVCREHRLFQRFFAPLWTRFYSKSRSERIIILVFLSAAILYAGTKPSAQSPAPASYTLQTSPKVESQTQLSDEQLKAGFALAEIHTNETHDFSMPTNALVHLPWRLRGASDDVFLFAPTNWFFSFGTNLYSSAMVHSGGVISFDSTSPTNRARLAVFPTTLGIVPEANWHLLSTSNSLFWAAQSSSNSLLLTWQNVLFHRALETPFSFQAELLENGDFIYRYNLASLTNVTEEIVVGAEKKGASESFALTNSFETTSLVWRHLLPSDTPTGDRDGDGLSTADEIFVCHTDPDAPDTDYDGLSDGVEIADSLNPLSRDTDNDDFVDGSDPDPLQTTPLDDLDGDGLPDAYENYWFDGTNGINASAVRLGTGFSYEANFHAGINPLRDPSVFESITNNLFALKLFDAFALPASALSTNLVFERTIPIARKGTWQHYFISSAPNAAGSWSLDGLTLEWTGAGGTNEAANASPRGDSLCLSVAPDAETLTVRLRATKPFVCVPKPLYLLAWAPRVTFPNAQTVETDERVTVVVTNAQMLANFSTDVVNYPAKTPPPDGSITAFPFSIDGPGIYPWPDVVPVASARRTRASPLRPIHRLAFIDPSLFYGTSHTRNWTSYYPLDSECLWKGWYSDASGYYVCACEPQLSLGAAGLDDFTKICVVADDRSWASGKVVLDGTVVWSNCVDHVYSESYSSTETLTNESECDDCSSGCVDGNCDDFEGTELGSLRFRIPLGVPRDGQISGFVWFNLDAPQTITRGLFNLMTRPDADVTDVKNNGLEQVVCNDLRGRTLTFSDIENGVRIVITTTASGKLEHTWELTNESDGGMRIQKISSQSNIMSDETFAQSDAGLWSRADNISQVREELSDETQDGKRIETRRLSDRSGNVFSHTITTYAQLGTSEYPLECEIERRELSYGNRWLVSRAAYWTDAQNRHRNGKLRFVSGDDRAWRYQTVDEYGRVKFSLEQWNGSLPPEDAADGEGEWSLNNLPQDARATATVYDYTPLAGDDARVSDKDKVRTVSRYHVREGSATLIDRTWTRYIHGTANGSPTATTETIRAGAATASIDDARNAVSSVTTYDTEAEGIPLILRGKPVSEMDEGGVLRTYTHTLAGNILTTTERTFNGAIEALTRRVTREDATYGNLLYEATEYAADSRHFDTRTHLYDSKNRLISTRYGDGSWTTNAYSCCRLLHTIDRTGAKTLRSALTGLDHLYYAMEEVSLGQLPHDSKYVAYEMGATSDINAYKVTQHFMDVLGRETNTVTRCAKAEGVAVNSAYSYGKGWRTDETTAYPDGTSDYSISTDARGVRTVTWRDAFQDREETTTEVYHPTNLTTAVTTTRTTTWRNGDTVSAREWGGEWTRETRRGDYAEDGTRVECVITESSDTTRAVTNSLTRYDFLGRIVSQETPQGTTETTYDGSSSRVLFTTLNASGIVRTTYHYDAHGDQIGTTQNGVTSLQTTTYETISNELWEVVTQVQSGTTVNVQTSVKRQLTGLSDALRSRTISTDAEGVSTETTSSFDATTQISTETTISPRHTPIVRKSQFGRLIETNAACGNTYNFYEAWGRVFYTERTKGSDTKRISVMWLGRNAFGDVEETDVWTASGNTYAATFTAFDAFGNALTTTNALGNVTENAYDALGQSVAVSGAAYPTRYAYDTAGRMTRLATTRDGVTWDTTGWMYDSATGLRTAKTYADGSQIFYTHTPTGKPLRTTTARGTWSENIYNEQEQVVAMVYSGETPTAYFERNELGHLLAESNTVATTIYKNTMSGVATNEVVTIGTETTTLTRERDACARQTSLAVSGGPTVMFGYNEESEIASVSAEGWTAHYRFTPDGYDAGVELTTTGGVQLKRLVERDAYRRSLVSSVTNTIDDAVFQFFVYTYDGEGRVTMRNSDAFLYNIRNEVTSATIENKAYRYAYDNIGNFISNSCDDATTSFASNPLNQYVSISPTNGTLSLMYDVDGNLTFDGVRTYAWDDANRLTTVSIGDEVILQNEYDTQSRRVRKVTPEATHTFVYDGWNLVKETIASTNGETEVVHYVWGKDLSGTIQGAGGVGGLLAVKRNGAWYHPFYDNNGNITAYVDAQGEVVASYAYDAFGNTIAQSGTMADAFPHRFSTKYFDAETGLYYYGYRFYSPTLSRWLNRDPIEEDGGVNLYAFCENKYYTVELLGLINIEKCARLLQEIYASAGKIVNALRKYDPLKDGQGGFAFFGGLTKPGGHYQKIIQQQAHLKKLLHEFTNTCLRDKGSDKGSGYPKWADQIANVVIPLPVFKMQQEIVTAPFYLPSIPDEETMIVKLNEFANYQQVEYQGEVAKTTATIAKKIGVGAVAAGGCYLIYRGIRMIPSFFPPLWFTVPVNMAVP